MENSSSDLGEWLEGRCREEGLSLRQVAAKAGLSHATIGDIIKGGHPSYDTIKKLARAFGGDGHQRLAVEDKLFVLAGYRSEPSQEGFGEPLARLLDKIDQFSESELQIMEHFADFISRRVND